VLSAVEVVLTDLRALSDEVGNLREAIGASRNYLRLTQVQYKFGLVDYLIVIDAERTLLSNQLSLAQAVNLQMGASIRLIKALRAGWDAGAAVRLEAGRSRMVSSSRRMIEFKCRGASTHVEGAS